MTRTQLDEAVKTLQLTDIHDSSVNEQSEDVTLDTATPHTGDHNGTIIDIPGGDDDMQSRDGDIQDDTCRDKDDTTLEDDTLNGVPDKGDGNHSDSSNDGLCIDYQSDAETEGLFIYPSVCLQPNMYIYAALKLPY